jgi:hypothetical protein
VVGAIFAYCPRRGCETLHMIDPPAEYGSPEPDSAEWSSMMHAYTGEDVLANGADGRPKPGHYEYLSLQGSRISRAARVRPKRRKVAAAPVE